MLNEEEVSKLKKVVDTPKDEKDKHNALMAGVIFFMILIVLLWVMNMGVVFKRPIFKNSNDLDIEKFSQEFQKTFNEVGGKVQEMKQITPADLESVKNIKYNSVINGASSSVKINPAKK